MEFLEYYTIIKIAYLHILLKYSVCSKQYKMKSLLNKYIYFWTNAQKHFWKKTCENYAVKKWVALLFTVSGIIWVKGVLRQQSMFNYKNKILAYITKYNITLHNILDLQP